MMKHMHARGGPHADLVTAARSSACSGGCLWQSSTFSLKRTQPLQVSLPDGFRAFSCRQLMRRLGIQPGSQVVCQSCQMAASALYSCLSGLEYSLCCLQPACRLSLPLGILLLL